MVRSVVKNMMITRRRGGLWVLALMILLVAGIAFASPAHAEDSPAALDVYYDDALQKSLTMEDLAGIASREESKKYTYSGFNTYPAAQLVEKVEGPTVQGILEDALKDTTFAEIGGGQTIEFESPDGVKECFLKEQLFADRKYFPQFRNESGGKGRAVQDSSKSGAVSVPAVISLKEDGCARGENGNYDVGRLLFGQISPSEQNHAEYVKHMAAGNIPAGTSAGKITVYSLAKKPVESWNPLETTDKGNGTGQAVLEGDEITFDRSVNRSHKENGSRYWIHYTMDGSDPDLDSRMYNYNNFSFGLGSEKLNRPKVEALGTLRIKAVVTGYGKRDSAVKNFTFTGVDVLPTRPPEVPTTAKPTAAPKTQPKGQPTAAPTRAPAKPVVQKLKKPMIKSVKSKKKKVTIKWKKVAGANGYMVYRAAKKKGKYKLIRTVKSGGILSCKDGKVKKKKKYYYKIRAYKKVSGKTIYSAYSAVKRIKVK